MKSNPVDTTISHKNISQKHIAAKVGVSESTVQRVFSDHPMVSDAVRSRVLGVAEKFGYAPNLNAKRLRLGRYESIGLVMGFRSYLRAILHTKMTGIATGLTDTEYGLNLVHFPKEAIDNPNYLAGIHHRFACDGLLINHTEDFTESFLSGFHSTHIPAVWMNFDKPVDCVYVDNNATAKDMVRYLYNLGHRSIACINMGGKTHYSTSAMIQGYREAAGELGVQVNLVDQVIDRRDRPAFFHRWLGGPQRPTAVITYSISVAYPLIRAALEMGLRVPQDLSVICISNKDEHNVGGWRMTYMSHPYFEVGRLAARMLTEKLSGNKEQPLPSIGLRCQVIEGETTCAV